MGMIELNHNFNKFVDESNYTNIISINDEAGCILKLQLIAENFLEVYLDERIPKDRKKFFMKRGEILKYFDEKLMISIAFGLPVELAEVLKYLNKVRNDFGHDFDRKLSSDDLNKFIDLAEFFKVKTTAPYLGDEDIRGTYIQVSGKNLSPKDGLIAGFGIATYCLMIRAGVWLANDLNKRDQLNLGKIL